ncbi:hypothetical protein M7I_7660 [Glarea lozoyensis 74030]|uniref:Uncharacterized protein n=1 Tax=Glarea lozoyensis (strain ATCC 74030 / MF5533) TaxID=1104152 RepID=H0EXW8_GLAL7|nr:hypothetical protein M7I_7660 [Glarea lozoyensis 74030]
MAVLREFLEIIVNIHRILFDIQGWIDMTSDSASARAPMESRASELLRKSRSSLQRSLIHASKRNHLLRNSANSGVAR